MAYLDDKIPQAYELSNRALNQPKFDTEAFIVASLIRLMNADRIDLVPDSNIDELTDTSKDLFVNYMDDRTDSNLQIYMVQIYQIISELYHTVDAGQKDIIKKYIEKLNDIN